MQLFWLFQQHKTSSPKGPRGTYELDSGLYNGGEIAADCMMMRRPALRRQEEVEYETANYTVWAIPAVSRSTAAWPPLGPRTDARHPNRPLGLMIIINKDICMVMKLGTMGLYKERLYSSRGRHANCYRQGLQIELATFCRLCR
jgi:hypothetical protein